MSSCLNIYDVYPQDLIAKVASILKQSYPEVKKPEGIEFLKTAHFKELPPVNPDFWFIRCASLLRKLYNGPVGMKELRKAYGGRKVKDTRKSHTHLASGAIIRRCLQQLQKAGLVEIYKKEGRILSAKGRSLLDKTATEIAKAQNRV